MLNNFVFRLSTVLLSIGVCSTGQAQPSNLGSQTVAKRPDTKRPLIIAHRGASGYLPEHSQGAKVLAFAQGADYLEQDVVLSRDGIFVISHDIILDHTTDVSERFPSRKRADGHYYYADFDWPELRQLSLRERVPRHDAFRNRFSVEFDQRIVRLEDEIRLIHERNRQFGRQVGLHIELKSPSFHLEQFGSRMSNGLLPLLALYGYRAASDRCFIQCFEFAELQYLRQELNCKLALVQLLGGRPLGLEQGVVVGVTDDGVTDDGVTPTAPKTSLSPVFFADLKPLATLVDGIGPSLELVAEVDSNGRPRSTGFVEAAQRYGLVVHPYTVRADALPSWAGSLDDLHAVLVDELMVDGFFTDFPDLSVDYCDLK